MAKKKEKYFAFDIIEGARTYNTLESLEKNEPRLNLELDGYDTYKVGIIKKVNKFPDKIESEDRQFCTIKKKSIPKIKNRLGIGSGYKIKENDLFECEDLPMNVIKSKYFGKTLLNTNVKNSEKGVKKIVKMLKSKSTKRNKLLIEDFN